MDKKVSITVVFGGFTHEDEYPPNQKLVQVVRSTLKAAGRETEDPAAWNLKNLAGTVLDQDLKISQGAIGDNDTLHLVAPAGEGG